MNPFAHIKKALKPSVSQEQGFEVPDPEPVFSALDFNRPLSIAETIRNTIRTEMSLVAGNQGHETFEEADDFDIPDEDMSSPYENEFDPSVSQLKEAMNSEIINEPIAEPDAVDPQIDPETVPED